MPRACGTGSATPDGTVRCAEPVRPARRANCPAPAGNLCGSCRVLVCTRRGPRLIISGGSDSMSAHQCSPPGPRPGVFTAALGLVLAGSAAAVTTAPGQSLRPPLTAPRAYPVADLDAGRHRQRAHRVPRAPTPDGFTGEVLGVLEDGIAPERRHDHDGARPHRRSTAVGGIWQGMSGSPVYADDGRAHRRRRLRPVLRPVAGRRRHAVRGHGRLPRRRAPPGKVEVGKGIAAKIAANTDVTAAEAEQGFTQLQMPFGVSGLSAAHARQGRRTKRAATCPRAPT